jgi:hypothetical protein
VKRLPGKLQAALSPVTMRAAALRSPLLGLLWLGLFD